MSIDWMALVKVSVVAFCFGVAIVTVFALGIVGIDKAQGDGAEPEVGRAQPATGASRAAGMSLAGVCFAACAAAVLYGLWLLIPQFH